MENNGEWWRMMDNDGHIYIYIITGAPPDYCSMIATSSLWNIRWCSQALKNDLTSLEIAYFFQVDYIIWLVVWNIFYFYIYIGKNHPNWLIFFRGVETTKQIIHVFWLLKFLSQIWVQFLSIFKICPCQNKNEKFKDKVTISCFQFWVRWVCPGMSALFPWISAPY